MSHLDWCATKLQLCLTSRFLPALQSTPTEKRILFLGDSYSVGYGNAGGTSILTPYARPSNVIRRKCTSRWQTSQLLASLLVTCWAMGQTHGLRWCPGAGAVLPGTCQPTPQELQVDWVATCTALAITSASECADLWQVFNENSLEAFGPVAAAAFGADFQVIANTGSGTAAHHPPSLGPLRGQ